MTHTGSREASVPKVAVGPSDDTLSSPQWRRHGYKCEGAYAPRQENTGWSKKSDNPVLILR